MEKRGQGLQTHIGVDPLEAAAYDTVHAYPGGAEALVKVVGGSAEVLRNQVSPNIKTHKLGLVQARQLVLATGDVRIAQQFAQDCGGVFVPIEKFNATGDCGLLQQQLRVAAAHGDFAKELDQALDDGKLTAAEISVLRDHGRKMLEAYEGMMARLSACQTAD